MKSIKLKDALIKNDEYVYSDRYGVVRISLDWYIKVSANNSHPFSGLYRKDGEDYIQLTQKDIINVFDTRLFKLRSSYYPATYNEIEIVTVIINFANERFVIKAGDREALNEFLHQAVWKISSTNFEVLMDFEIKQDMLVACKNERGRTVTWRVAELYHQPNYQGMLCKLQSVTDEEVMEIPCYPLDNNGKRGYNSGDYKILYKLPYVEYPQQKNELEIFDDEIREAELNPFWLQSEKDTGKGNLYWQPIEEASQYNVTLYKYRPMDSLEKKLYILETFVVDRNKCWITLDNLVGNNYIVRIEAEGRSGSPVALSRGIPIRVSGKTDKKRWAEVKL